jgi:hypothetical protein
MTTRALRATIPAALVLALASAGVLASCSGDDETASPTTTTVAATTTLAATTTTEGASSIITESIPATADLPNVSTGDTADLPLPPATADLPLVIDVTVGVDSGPDRIEQIPVGTPVTLRLINPSAVDEYHVHGIDLGDGQEFAAGQVAAFTFTLDAPGDYEVESHATDTVLVVLQGV